MPENSGGGLLGLILYFAFFAGVMYLLIFLPQKRRDKKMKQMLDALSVGDNVVTAGGILGKVINIKDDEVTIETSVEKTKLNLKKWAIRQVEELIKA